MLIRQTLLYLPAQLLPALFQFGALIAWSHFATAEVIGIVALFISIQEFLNVGFIGFWNQYTVRFTSKSAESPSRLAAERRTATLVLCVSIVIQSLIALPVFFLAIDPSASWPTAAVLAVLVASRTLNLFQGERARARGDIVLYSVGQIMGPVFGTLLGLLLLWRLGPDAFWIFLGFAAAQLAGAVFGLARDSAWVRFGKPDRQILRHALSYGAPIIVSNTVAWLTQNASRLMVGYTFGLAAAGIYSLGFGLGFRASIIASMSVTAAAFPLAVRLSNAGDADGAKAQLSTNGALLFGVLCASLAGLALVADDVLTLLIAPDMRGPTYPILMWCLLAGGIISIRTYFLNQIFLLQAKTGVVANVAVGEAILATTLAIIAVPPFGAVGGAVALTISASLGTLATLWLSVRAGLPIPVRHFAKVLVATAVMAAAILLMPTGRTAELLVLRIACGGSAFVAALIGLYWTEFTRLVAELRKRKRKP